MSFPEHNRLLIGNYAHPSIDLVQGKGTKVWDSSGKEYLDFTCGIAVTNVGHCHPHWTAMVAEQANKLTHCSNLFSIPEQVRLAERLAGYVGPGKVLFCNSGAEANEALIKLSRLHSPEQKRPKILTAVNGFHGRTMGALSATHSSKYRHGFEPLLQDFAFGQLNHITSFSDLADDQTGAILIESIQGEGGIHEATDAFLNEIRELCQSKNLLLMLDEVQAGIGRTGEFLGFQKSGILPDAVAIAKGLGGGFPIGAIWVGSDLQDTFTPGSHGTTFGGSPLACAAAHAVLDILESENLIVRSRETGAQFKGALEELCREFPDFVEEIRGRGFMLGVACKKDPAGLIATMREHGLLTVGASGHVIRILPPLNVRDDELEHALSIMRTCMAQLKP